jgi:hypothetical protein
MSISAIVFGKSVGVVRHEPVGSGLHRRGEVHRVGRAQAVRGAECRRQLGGGAVDRAELETGEERGQRLDLVVGAVAEWLRQQLGQQEHRPDPGNGAGSLDRLAREQPSHPPPEPVPGHGRVHEDVGV